MPRVRLHGRPIAITGASSGIGAATATACARAGMPVALFARRADKLEALRDAIERTGGTAISVVGDTANPADCRRLLDDTERALGPLYAVFANAGYGQETPCHAMGEDDIRRMFDVNFFGSLNVVRPAVARFKARGAGHAIMCSSCLSKISIPFYGTYSATKAAQDHFGRAMRLELRRTGVHVSTVHPIGTRTEFFERAHERSGSLRIADRSNTRLLQPPERVARAVVKCLARPRGEVWTSTPTRLALALACAFPALTDRALASMTDKRLAQTGPDPQSPGSAPQADPGPADAPPRPPSSTTQ